MNRPLRNLSAAALTIGALALSGCAADVRDESASSPTQSATSTPSATSSASATPTPTETQASTPAATPTQTQEPVAAPSASTEPVADSPSPTPSKRYDTVGEPDEWGNVTYDSLEDLVHDFEAVTGEVCAPDLENDRQKPMYASEAAHCADTAVISLYANQADRDAQVEITDEAITSLGIEDMWVVGENWIINGGDPFRISAYIGGEVVALGAAQ